MWPGYLVASLVAEMLNFARFVCFSSTDDKRKDRDICLETGKWKNLQAMLIEGQI
jgi:hypothetical protein